MAWNMTGTERKRTNIGVASAICCEALFGLSYVFTKQATANATPLSLLGWRFAIAFIAIAACRALGMIKTEFGKKPLWMLLAIAILNPVIYFSAETWGISMLTAAESGAFLACIPVASVIASAAILHRAPGRRQTIGIAVTLIGVLTAVFASGMDANFSLTGYIILAIAVVSYALYSVSVEKASGYSEAEITFVMLASGAAVFIAGAVMEAVSDGNLSHLLLLPFRDAGFLIAVLYQGLCCSIAAFFLSNAAISRIGVNRTSSFIGLSTAVSIIAGIAFLGESFSLLQCAGTIIILAGIYTANTESSRQH